MKYYIIAGERSGDLHGSNLIKRLRQKDKTAEIRAWGGDQMQKAGAELAVHYRDISFMGIWEVLVNLKTISRYVRFCKEDILKFKPDVLVLIDYPGFNLKIAKFAYNKGFKVCYYISPKVWAWNASRVRHIKAYVHRMLTILPFETAFYKQHNYKVEFVGNPVADAVNGHTVNTDFLEQNKLPEDKPIVAALPGSRTQELRQILPLMRKAADAFPEFHFAVAAVRNLDEALYAPAKDAPNMSLVFEQTYDLLAFADGAIVASGTATLETALWDVPQTVVYKTSPLTYWVGKRLVKLKFISLVNLIANKEVVKELIQNDLTPEKLVKEVGDLMKNKQRRQFILSEYKAIKEKLGDKKASDTAASRIIDLARRL